MDGDVEQRIAAVDHDAPDGSLGLVERGLRDPHPRVRGAAARARLRFHPHDAAAARLLVDSLDGAAPWETDRTLGTLARLPYAVAAGHPALVDAMDDLSVYSTAALEAVARHEGATERVLSCLIRLLAAGSDDAAAVAERLVTGGRDAAVRILAARSRDRSAEVRWECVQALAHLGATSDDALDALRRAARDADLWVRLAAAEALATLAARASDGDTDRVRRIARAHAGERGR